MDRTKFLRARIMHNEVQEEQVHECRMLLVRTSIDVGAHHVAKARGAIGLALRDLCRAIEADRDEIADLTESDDGAQTTV